MSLNRRIVLDDSEINSAPEPIPVKAVVGRGTFPSWTCNNCGRLEAGGMGKPTICGTCGWNNWKQEQLKEEVLQSDGSLAEAALARAIRETPELTQFQEYNDFLTLNRIGRQADLACNGCSSRRGFETDFNTRSLMCKSCGRKTSFELFATEHPG